MHCYFLVELLRILVVHVERSKKSVLPPSTKFDSWLVGRLTGRKFSGWISNSDKGQGPLREILIAAKHKYSIPLDSSSIFSYY